MIGVLKIKPTNLVVMKITTDKGDIIDDRDEFDLHIKRYFETIYRAPDEWENRM